MYIKKEESVCSPQFVQVYVFVREHQHSILGIIKKERSSLSYKFCRGLVVIFFAKRRQFSWSFHSSFFLFLSYFLFLLEGHLWKRRNSKRKKFFWILFWKFFWKFFLKSGPAGLFSELFYFVYSSSIIVIVHDTSEWISRYPWWGSVTRPLKIPRYLWRVILHDTSEH